MYYSFTPPCNREILTVFEDHYSYAPYDLYKLYKNHAIAYHHADECYRQEWQEETYIQQYMVESDYKP